MNCPPALALILQLNLGLHLLVSFSVHLLALNSYALQWNHLSTVQSQKQNLKIKSKITAPISSLSPAEILTMCVLAWWVFTPRLPTVMLRVMHAEIPVNNVWHSCSHYTSVFSITLKEKTSCCHGARIRNAWTTSSVCFLWSCKSLQGEGEEETGCYPSPLMLLCLVRCNDDVVKLLLNCLGTFSVLKQTIWITVVAWSINNFLPNVALSPPSYWNLPSAQFFVLTNIFFCISAMELSPLMSFFLPQCQCSPAKFI